MPYPYSGEDKSTFMQRSIKYLIDNEGKSKDQAIAISYSLWERRKTPLHNESCFVIMDNYPYDDFDIIHEIISTPTLVAASLLAPKLANGINSILDIKSDKIPIDPSILSSKDQPSNANKIHKPSGIIIEDTYNNLFFPIPLPQIDTSKFSLPDIKHQYQSMYSKLENDFLPWHFVIEMISGNYYVFNTRPIDVVYPLTTVQAKDYIAKNNINLDKVTNKYFFEEAFELSNAIHICIIGDTNKDVYTLEIYNLIGRICAGPIMRYFKIPPMVGPKLVGFNIGKKFLISQLDFYLKR